MILNTLVLSMDGLFSDQNTLDLLAEFNLVFTIIFIVEMVIKIIGLTPKGYASDKMNLFDGLIVLLSIVELVMPTDTSDDTA